MGTERGITNIFPSLTVVELLARKSLEYSRRGGRKELRVCASERECETRECETRSVCARMRCDHSLTVYATVSAAGSAILTAALPPVALSISRVFSILPALLWGEGCLHTLHNLSAFEKKSKMV